MPSKPNDSRRGLPWTAEETAHLKQNYRTINLIALSEVLQRAPQSVQKKAEELRLTRGLKGYWTEEQIRYLKDRYPFDRMDSLKSALAKSAKAISGKAFDLKLKKQQGWNTQGPLSYDIRLIKANGVVMYEHKNLTKKVCREIRKQWCKDHMEKLQSQEWVMSIIHNL